MGAILLQYIIVMGAILL